MLLAISLAQKRVCLYYYGDVSFITKVLQIIKSNSWLIHRMHASFCMKYRI